MALNLPQGRIQQAVFFLLPLAAFILPISQTLRSILLPLTLLVVLLQPFALKDLKRVLAEPWCLAAILLFTVILLGCFFGDATWKEKTAFLNKYSKLLYLPILAIAFQEKRLREMAIHAYLFAMLITMILSFLKFKGWIVMAPTDEPATVFANHIVTGYYMSFAAFLAALYCIKKQGAIRFAYLGLVLLFSFQTLFINIGRTGYATYAIFLALLLCRNLPWRKLPFYLLLALPLFVFTAYQSPILINGVNTAIHDLQYYNSGNKNTSLGFRIQFHQYAKKLFLDSPILGQGTAGFSHHYAKDQPIPAWGAKLSDPHNEYFLTAVEHGVVGLFALVWFFITLFYAYRQLQETRTVFFALLFTFTLANFFDSFLLFSASGFFLIFFAAICLGESLSKPVTSDAKVALQWRQTPC